MVDPRSPFLKQLSSANKWERAIPNSRKYENLHVQRGEQYINQGTLQRLCEKSDYDDFYIASREKAEEQFQTAELVISSVKEYLSSKFAE